MCVFCPSPSRELSVCIIDCVRTYVTDDGVFEALRQTNDYYIFELTLPQRSSYRLSAKPILLYTPHLDDIYSSRESEKK